MKQVQHVQVRRLAVGVAGGALLGGVLVAAAAVPASAASPYGPVVFGPTSSLQQYVVPANVTKISIVAKGASGGAGQQSGGAGAAGSVVSGSFAVTPGQALSVMVGKAGVSTNPAPQGWNGGGAGGAGHGGGGGGSGGDASAVGTDNTAANQLVVAAGGGGGGGKSDDGKAGGAGGAGTAAGVNGGDGTGRSGDGGAGGSQGFPGNSAGGDGWQVYSNGGGGGGGGGLKGGTGGKSGGNTFGGGGGGGGGGGSSKGTVTGANSGNGSVTITSIEITNKLNDGLVGTPYSVALTAAGGTSYTWALTGGTLPVGLTLNNGVVSGTPTKASSATPVFTATDASGAAATMAMPVDIFARGNDAVVFDGPATNVTTTAATGHGKVQAGSVDVTSIYCRIATSAGGVDAGTQVIASPATTPAGGAGVPITCDFAALTQTTQYFYKVYAVDSFGLHDSGDPQTFTTLTDVKITTTGLSDGVVGVAYSEQLAATGGTGTYVWTLADGSPALPDGLSMSPTGLIAGTPLTAQAVSVTFVATDGNGVAATSPPIAMDIAADAEVVDDPATNVLATTATGNGQVTPGTSDVNPIYCQIATSPADVDTGEVVFAVPKTLATGSPATPTTCSFVGLTQATTYYYKVYADDAGGTHNSGSPQSFTTATTVQITTEGVSDGMVGTPYAQQLTATGGTGAYTWEITGGILPDGLSMSNAGLISGTPTTAVSVDLTFTVTDSLGITDTSPPISFDIAAPSGFAVALDGPATAITAHTATGNGQVVAGNSMVTLIYCKIATSADGVDAASSGVFARPSWTIAGGLPVPVTCAFTGLNDQTTYYYKLYAVDSMGTHGSGSAQAFVTLNNPANDQTAKVSAPRTIKYKGTTTLLKRTTKTNIGTKVKVTVKLESKKPPRGVQAFKVITNKKSGKVEVQTFGRKIKLMVKYSAPANKGYTAWSEVHHYVNKK